MIYLDWREIAPKSLHKGPGEFRLALAAMSGSASRHLSPCYTMTSEAQDIAALWEMEQNRLKARTKAFFVIPPAIGMSQVKKSVSSSPVMARTIIYSAFIRFAH